MPPESYGTFEAGASETIILIEQPTPRRRNTRTIVIWVCLLSVLFALILWTWESLVRLWAFMLCSNTFYPRGAPKTWDGFKNQSFAVGFDLTAGYG
jgi:hypothetical protein